MKLEWLECGLLVEEGGYAGVSLLITRAQLAEALRQLAKQKEQSLGPWDDHVLALRAAASAL